MTNFDFTAPLPSGADADTLQPHRRIILDVHTHHPAPQPEGIIAVEPENIPAPDRFPGQFYSVGIHPWSLAGLTLPADRLQRLREAAARPDVVAIGETGIDTVHSGAAPMAGQLNAFRQHVELSEELAKPLVIHCVKGQDMILGVHREMQPKQPWIVHGFRGKPTVMRMLTDRGICLSFGIQFNAASLEAVPTSLLLAETDEAPCRIQDVIAALNAVREEVTPDLLAANMRRILNLPGSL